MHFKLWITLNEARILPHSLVKDIYDYIMDVAKQKAVKPRTAVPSKPFIVDFTGTPYEFLNELPDHEREVAVDGNLTGDDHGVFEPNGRFPSISINVQKQPERLYGTLQHEFMHFLQELIQLHAHNKRNKTFAARLQDYQNRKLDGENVKRPVFKNPSLGFMPPAPLVKRMMKKQQVDIEGDKKDGKRIAHPLRPVEYYTNLQSILFDMMADFYNDVTEHNLSPIKLFNDIKAKKIFFEFFLRKNELAFHTLALLKINDNALYELYLKKLANQFVNKKFTEDDIEMFKNNIKMTQGVKDSITNAEKAKEEKGKKVLASLPIKLPPSLPPESFKGSIKFNNDNKYELVNLSDAEYELYDVAEDILKIIGAKEKEDSRGNYIWTLAITLPNVFKIFKNLKEAKDKEKDKALRCNIDHAADVIAWKIAAAIANKTGGKINVASKAFLKAFYPGPYEECETDEDGYFTDK